MGLYADSETKSGALNGGAPKDTLAYDDDNRLSTWNSQTVIFDADGNMTNGPLPSGTFGTYVYDARNRLISASGGSYSYTPDGLRVAVTGTGAANYVVDPNAALSRTLIRVKGGVTTYYVYGYGLLYEDTAGATKTYHYNHHGSTVAITTTGTTVIDRFKYAPYGALVARTGSSDTPFQLHGELGVLTDANGLNYMRARYYNPRIMRFCNADPIGFGGGLNHYAFVGNNPISFTDPFGLCRNGQDENGNGGSPVVMDPFNVYANAPNSRGHGEGVETQHVVGLAAESVDLAGKPSVGVAEKLVEEGRFMMSNGNTYKVGFYGNQAAGYSSVEVAAAKTTTNTMATAGAVIKVGGATVGVVVAGVDVYTGGGSNQSLVKGGVGVAGAATAFIPVVGPFVAIGIGVVNAFGGFNGLYNHFDDAPRFNQYGGAGGTW